MRHFALIERAADGEEYCDGSSGKHHQCLWGWHYTEMWASSTFIADTITRSPGYNGIPVHVLHLGLPPVVLPTVVYTTVTLSSFYLSAISSKFFANVCKQHLLWPFGAPLLHLHYKNKKELHIMQWHFFVYKTKLNPAAHVKGIMELLSVWFFTSHM